MKAYEIKVTIKGSKPPIWRKIIIPAGINFMQLHNIIQVAFEWMNYHLYEFTFKDISDRITNDTEACDEYNYFTSKEGKQRFKEMFGFCLIPSKTLYAKEVSIDEYFKRVKKLIYVYDFGDWWEHTIEIMNVIEDYEYEYPKVTKFRQISPPDDCGGIDGYYEFLEQYLDEENPEQASIAAWAYNQGYHDDYDIDEINKEMEDVLEFDVDDLF